MSAGSQMNRRGFLGAATALGATGILAGPSHAAGPLKLPGHRPPHGRPPRAHVVIRNATVLTMDPTLGDLDQGDVHVRDGRIVAVGGRVRAPGAKAIDGRDLIVLPGFVETHWHVWNTLLRSMAGDSDGNLYFPLMARVGPHFQPVDTYRAVRLALADAMSSGTTTLHDWSHNIRGPEYAEANVLALDEVGVRARFSYGTPQGALPTETIDFEDFDRVHREWIRPDRAELLTLGLAGRAPGQFATLDVTRQEWAFARDRGLPVSVHVGLASSDQFQVLSREGLLGTDVQLIHATAATPADIELIAASGSPVSISPWSELLVGFGFPLVNELVAAGAPLSLSVDTAAITGTVDMFSIMRLTLGIAHGVARAELGLTARQVLEMATIDGARGLGLDDQVGSLTPGKRADLILLRAGDLNIAPISDPVRAVVLAAGPANVDTVIVDGRILKRDGHLVVLDPERLVAEANESFAAVTSRAGSGTPAVTTSRAFALGCCGM